MIPLNKDSIQKEMVDAWFAEWENLRDSIHHSHESRDGQAKQLMEQGISLFETFIIQGSITELKEIDGTIEFELMPLNGRERLMFIKMKPGQYACYRQLDELFKETKKRMARLRLKA